MWRSKGSNPYENRDRHPGAGDLGRTPAKVGAGAAAVDEIVGAADAECRSGAEGEERAAIALREVEETVGPEGDGVERVIVIAAVEAGEEDVALVDGGVEFPVAVDVGVDDQVGGVGDEDAVVDDRHAERSDEAGLLDEGVRFVGAAVAVGIGEDGDAVALGLAVGVTAVVDALGDPDAALSVDVHVGGIAKERRAGPDGDLEALGDFEKAERNGVRQRGDGGSGGGRSRGGGGLGRSLGAG